MVSPLIKDRSWVTQAFLVPANELDLVEQQNRFFSTAELKFTDTSPGGNFAINPPPQFTPNADPRADSKFKVSKGMGIYYSEAIDDNSQVIYMRFGVANFNSLTQFFTGFYNTDAGRLARTGRSDSMFYTIGKVAGFVVSVIAWPLWLVQFAGVAIRFALDKPASKFYDFKPTMPLYWNAVTTIVNHIATNKGIVPRLNEEEGNKKLGLGIDSASRQAYAKQFPNLFDPNGGIDIYAMATRAQRLSDALDKKIENAAGGGFVASTFKAIYNTVFNTETPSLQSYIEKWAASGPGQVKTDDKSGDSFESMPNWEEGKTAEDDGFLDFAAAELRDGSAFVGFRVNYTGSVSESFSSSVGESDLAQKINSTVGSARSARFSFADGNISDLIGGAVGAAKDMISGALDAFGASGLVALAGSAFVDIPKHWISSSASLPRANYTIHLNAPYGNPMSRFLNIDIPLAMLLAAALPLSTGKQSYSSPFLVQLYDKGRCQTRLGMIDSLSITRGTGNIGFNADGQPLGVEVTFSIVDLSSIMHMPISEGFTINPATALFDEETVFSDYMAVLSSLDLRTQFYPWEKFKLNLVRATQHWDTFFSKSHFMNWLGDTPPARLISIPFKTAARN